MRELLEDLRARMPRREAIGPPECPIMDRWTLWWRSGRHPKLLLHHFLPDRVDLDCHDHPRPFITFIFRGAYDDLIPCPSDHAPYPKSACALCIGSEGLIVGDRLRAPAIRFRRAEYSHITRTDRRGAWTLVLMFSVRRAWGFWREGKWWPFREYEKHFGLAVRCGEDPPARYGWDGAGAGEGG